MTQSALVKDKYPVPSWVASSYTYIYFKALILNIQKYVY